MTKFRHTNPRLNFLLSILSCLFLLSACGDGDSTSNGSTSETGALAFDVVYHSAAGDFPSRAAVINCAGEGVATVEAEVYDPFGTLLQSGGPWDCEAGHGTIMSVPAGEGRTLVILGKDSAGEVVFRGQKEGIHVLANSPNNVGTIECSAFVPRLPTPADGAVVISDTVALRWDAVTGATGYGLIVSENNDLSNPFIDEIVISPDTATTVSHSVSGLSNATTYYWQVAASDSYDNAGIGSRIWSFSVNKGTIKPSLLVDGTEITLHWNSVPDALSYNIYWSTTPNVSTTNYEGKFKVANQTSFTHTLLTFGTPYYYALTAENAYGETEISLEVVGVAGMDFDWYPTTAYDRGYGVALAKEGYIYMSGETLAGGTEFPNVNFLFKQRADGLRLWTATTGVLHPNTPSMGGGNSIALDDLDANQNCYITGHTFENLETSGRDIFVEKYNSAGQRLWANGISTPSSDHAYDIAVYSNNLGPAYDTYITGFVSGAVGNDVFQGQTDIVVAKFNKDGVRQWVRTLGTSQWDVAYGIATDRYGHPYITGRTWGDLTGQGSGIFVAKYNASSALEWCRTIQAEGADSGYGNAIAVDQYGNAYVSGYVGPANSRKIILAKYNDRGEELWVTIEASSQTINSMGIALDEAESVYLVGYAMGNVNSMLNQGGPDILVAKYNAYGVQQWIRIFGSPDYDVAQRIVVRNKMCYIVGYSDGSLNGASGGFLDDAFLLKLPLE